MLTFPKRPRRDQTIAVDRKPWTSTRRQYRVTFSRCRYGPRDEREIPDVCYPQHSDEESGVWDAPFLNGNRDEEGLGHGGNRR